MKRRNTTGRIFAFVLHQIWNEKRSNIALFFELMIVSAVVWYIVDFAFVKFRLYNEPEGFDSSCCYSMSVEKVDADLPDFDKKVPDTREADAEDFKRLVARLKILPEIDEVAFSHLGEPYNYNGSWDRIEYVAGDTIYGFPRQLFVSPEYITVFRLRGTDGRSPEELRKAFEADKDAVLLSDSVFSGFDASTIVGKRARLRSGEGNAQLIAGTIEPMKRMREEERAMSQVIVMHPQSWHWENYSNYLLAISVRVKPGCDDGFEAAMLSRIKNKKFRSGNLYISGVESYASKKYAIEDNDRLQMRYYAIGMGFLLLNVFLGLLGTFWFRTQHRYPEIGVQKAFGATRADVMLRLFSEAAIILTLSFLPSVLICLNVAHAEMNAVYCGTTLESARFLVTETITYAIMLLIIVLGVWIPAWKATGAEPVEVLRAE